MEVGISSLSIISKQPFQIPILSKLSSNFAKMSYLEALSECNDSQDLSFLILNQSAAVAKAIEKDKKELQAQEDVYTKSFIGVSDQQTFISNYTVDPIFKNKVDILIRNTNTRKKDNIRLNSYLSNNSIDEESSSEFQKKTTLRSKTKRKNKKLDKICSFFEECLRQYKSQAKQNKTND